MNAANASRDKFKKEIEKGFSKAKSIKLYQWRFPADWYNEREE